MLAATDIGSLIERRPEHRGGRPVVAGTSVSVHRIVGWYKLGLHTRLLREGKSHAGLILASQQRYSVGEPMQRILRMAGDRDPAEM